MPHTEGLATYASVSMPSNFDSAALGTQTLVSTTSSIVDFSFIEITSSEQFVNTKQDANKSSKSGDYKPNCMAFSVGQFKAKGFSKKTRKLLSASWRAGTQKDYKCKFKKFSSWCGERKIDPYEASLNNVANFLTSLYEKGLKYRTIAGYRSMLSFVLPPIENVQVGQHPYIIRLLKGVFNIKPPKHKLVPDWGLPLVLQMLKQSI